jgi:uncharacterized protein (TIGR03067 family)
VEVIVYPTLLLGAALTIAAPGLKDPPEKGRPLVGEWVAERATVAGAEQPGNVRVRYVFRADGTWAMYDDDGRVSARDSQTYTVDAGKRPPAIDLSGSGPKGGRRGTVEGIYKVDGDTLTLCLAMGKAGRPTAFESSKEAPTMLIVFKRAKAKE